MAKRYKVTINKRGRIPFIGTPGPILKPRYISEEVYTNLVKLGYPVKIVPEVKSTPVVNNDKQPVVSNKKTAAPKKKL
jgi:hypothetical protein